MQPPAEEGSEEDKEGGSDKADGISLGGAVRAAEAAAISASVGEVPIRFVIVDLSPCSYLDTTALHFLGDSSCSASLAAVGRRESCSEAGHSACCQTITCLAGALLQCKCNAESV